MDNMTDTISSFMILFRGRGDCYGSEEGGCVRQQLTTPVFTAHLRGEIGIGVYPAVPASVPFCVWGCIDIDVEDLEAARLMQRTLGSVGITAWVERSRSKGYHVWVFADNRVPAEDMRRMLLVAHQVADYPAREVNPKQSDVSVTKVGNYVRLPYYGGLQAVPSRRVMLDDANNPIPLEEFVVSALGSLTPVSVITHLASFYKPPARPPVEINWGDISESLDDALRSTSQLARIIWRDGPLEGQDRSTALTRLAHVCFRAGITPSMCHVIVIDADKRWGKYHLRGENGQEEIRKIVERAYRG